MATPNRFPSIGHYEADLKLGALPWGAKAKLARKHNLRQSRISSVWPGGKMPDRAIAGFFLEEFGISWDAWDKPATKAARHAVDARLAQYKKAC